MKAIQLTGLNGFESLKLVDIEKPRPGANEVLIEVKAAGINYAELEQTRGRYPSFKPLPFVMGFEAAGIVAEAGPGVTNLRVGDRLTTAVTSGGFAEFALADAHAVIPIPDELGFAEATTITIQGLSAYTLLKYAAKPAPGESLLIQAAAGGVGLYLVQLAKLMGVTQVIALASSVEKLNIVKGLGADVVIDYTDPRWTERVLEATGGKGVDMVLEMSSGRIRDESFKLTAPFGRVIFYGAKNMHDTISSEQMQQLIHRNQTLTGFNFPTLQPGQIADCVPELLGLISQGKVKLFARHFYPLARVKEAFEALASRHTIGKVVLVP
jgi:NADPH2:quinone reductase